jgi:translation initiation factor IF-2
LNEKEREVKDRIRAIELGEDPDQYVAQQQRLRDAVKVREIPVLIKADVLGSIEAIKDALAAFPADEAKVCFF